MGKGYSGGFNSPTTQPAFPERIGVSLDGHGFKLIALGALKVAHLEAALTRHDAGQVHAVLAFRAAGPLDRK